MAKEVFHMINERTQKVTAHIPVNILHKAQSVTGKGITETLKIALTQLARANAYEDLRKMRGKIKFSVDLDERVIDKLVK